MAQKWRGIERRKRFWGCVRATHEADLKRKLDGLAQLGNRIVEDLIRYNKKRWCKTYFQTFFKYDSVDNNMAENFNAWILGHGNKTIITMLEEIKVNVMIRVSKSRAFAKTWVNEISPMAMMVFNINTEKSI